MGKGRGGLDISSSLGCGVSSGHCGDEFRRWVVVSAAGVDCGDVCAPAGVLRFSAV